MASPAGTCTAITHTGARCSSLATDSTGQCSHHARMSRVMALVPKSLSPLPSSSSNTILPSLLPLSSCPSSTRDNRSSFTITSLSNDTTRTTTTKCLDFLPGETILSTLSCSFVFPGALTLPEIPGVLYITLFRLRFEPECTSLRTMGGFHRLLDMAMYGMPRAAVAKLLYPQATGTASRSLNVYTSTSSSNSRSSSSLSTTNGNHLTPTRLVIKFKDLRSWILGGNVSKLLVTLNRYVYMDSPLSLFAFKSMEFLTLEDLQGHALYNLYADFERMGVALKDGTSAYRVTELNATFVMCPTYPRQLVVPAAASDVEVGAVASFRSKGRLPICSYVHAHNGAALWRCAQPKRGILHAQNDADEEYLLHIARASSSSTSSYSGTRTRKIWIADCRPELNARVNNLTGGGTESGNLAHARVSFLNIGNIHAMRESIEAVRGLGGFMASTNNTESTDLLWGARVEDTKWLLHVRRILSGALQVAHALEAQATTVVVHCSDGWDRTAQLCGLAQLLVDGHYRSRRGFLEVIEKEWVRAGHKFQDRVAPGKTEDDDQQAPIFLQFLDCVWQLIRIFPTHFEFNERMLETMADAVFSGRYGTFLGNCECERGTWSVRERTPSLYASILRDDRYVNPFYRGSSTAALLPEPSSVLRQVTLWSSYYFRGAPFLASSAGNPAPPMYAVTVEGEGNAVSSGAQEDMEIAMMAALRRIRVLEDKLSTAAAMSAPPPGPSPVSYPPLYSAASELGMCARVHQNSQPEMPIHQNSQPEMPIHQNSQPEMPIHQQSFKDDFHHSSSNCSSTSSDRGVYAAPALPVLPQVSTLSFSTPAPVSVQPSVPTATWTCRLCTKSNAAGVLQCVVCGRTPR